MGNGMQLLIHGWLSVSWGQSPWFLLAFAASRVLPKVALTVPAGIVCDRTPRVRILLASRWVKVGGSLLPLVGFFAPLAIVWLLVASAIAAVAHTFEVPAERALIGDITASEDLQPAVALNNAGAHVSALMGPSFAFLLVAGAGRPGALLVSAAILAAGALVTLWMPDVQRVTPQGRHGAGLGGMLTYLGTAPVLIPLLAIGLLPGVTDKSVALALPSVADGHATIGIALLAPEIGALFAASLLSLLPVRLGLGSIVAASATYALLIAVAMRYPGEPGLLIGALAVAGMAKMAFSVSALARVQQLVPAELRGRVLAI